MSSFTGPLTITEIDVDLDLWRVETSFVYEVGEKGSGRAILVPPGIYDGASIPRPLRIILPAWGRWRRAALVHDELYNLLRAGKPHVEAPTRRDADAIFYEALRALRVDLLLSCLFWAAVRVGGWPYTRPPKPPPPTATTVDTVSPAPAGGVSRSGDP